ncbi:MAG: hypothetical protein J7L21_03405, partial [Sulfurimonas sp.]|nr:hypothetical protein [Sulfurimonas sp.]
ITLTFFGCSSAKLEHSWQKTKDASFVAVSDPITWGSALSAGLLYATYDDDITEHFMNHNLFDSDVDETLRSINGVTLYSSALFIEKDTKTELAQRLLVDFTGSAVARQTTTTLNTLIKKEIPAGDEDYAIGSHHALDTFANSALTRKNISDMEIPTWGKYTINSISYISAAGSAFARIQEGGHSFADQLASVSIGNFIGAFFYEALIRDDENDIQNLEVSINRDSFFIKTAWNF